MNTMNARILVIAILLLLLLPVGALAQNEEPPTPPAVEETDMETIAWGWLEKASVGLVALAPVGKIIVDALKKAWALLGLPEGYTGYVVVAAALALVIVAFYADVFERQNEVSTVLGVLEQIAYTVGLVLGMVITHRGSNKLNLLPGLAGGE